MKEKKNYSYWHTKWSNSKIEIYNCYAMTIGLGWFSIFGRQTAIPSGSASIHIASTAVLLYGVERKAMANALRPTVTRKPITSKYLICTLDLSCLLRTNIHNRLHRWLNSNPCTAMGRIYIHSGKHQVLPLHLIGMKKKLSRFCTLFPWSGMVDLLNEHTVLEGKLFDNEWFWIKSAGKTLTLLSILNSMRKPNRFSLRWGDANTRI